MDPVYNLVQRFLDVGAVETAGAGHGKVKDPVSLMVRVTKGTLEDSSKLDLADITVEEILPVEKDRLRRIRTGYWMFSLDPAKLEWGATYTVHWRYEMTPGSVNVVRETFIWEQVPEVPQVPGNVIVYGTIADPTGAPIPDQTLVMEEYEDPSTLTRRTGQITIHSNSFGLWWVEVPARKIVRFVLGEVSKIVQIPSQMARVALRALPSYQARDIIRKDRYGYPLPSQNIFEALQKRLSRGDAIMVLQSLSAVQNTSITDATALPESGDSVTPFVHEQPNQSTVWTIEHNCDGFPVVSVIDEDGVLVFPDVTYPDNNKVILTFEIPTAGRAILLCASGY